MTGIGSGRGPKRKLTDYWANEAMCLRTGNGSGNWWADLDEDDGQSSSNEELEEGVSADGPGRNPMIDQVVLTRFFEVCELADVRRFRLVSKQWYDLSLTRWRKEMTLTIKVGNRRDDDVDGDGYLGPMDDTDAGKLDWRDVSKLYNNDEFNKLEAKPYKSYRLSSVKFTNPGESYTSMSSISTRTRSRTRWSPYQSLEQFSNDVADMDKFWEKCGPSMRRLDLLIPRISSVDALCKVIFEDTPNLEYLRLVDVEWSRTAKKKTFENDEEAENVKVQPNLKSLTIGLSWQRALPMKWEVLFKHFPNIENLELIGFVETSEIDALVATLEQLIKAKRQRIALKSLNFSKLYIQDSDPVRSLLHLKQIALESLHFAVWTCEDDAQSVLPRTLQHHGKFLKELVLANVPLHSDRAKAYENLPFSPYPLTALTTLKLSGTVCTNFQFFTQIPNVKILHIHQYSDELEAIIKDAAASLLEQTVLPHVVEFEIGNSASNHYCLPEELMKRLVKLMPNVKRLKAQLTPGAFRIVCENWKDLRVLDTLKSKLNDFLLTGVLANGQHNGLPNLTNLKYLYVMSIGRGENLRDESIYNGFLKMAYLHTLSVTVSTRTSDAAFNALTKRFPGSDIGRHIPNSYGYLRELCVDWHRFR